MILHTADAAAGQDYQLWLIRGERRLSACCDRSSGATGAHRRGPRGRPARAFAVTRQGGTPQPTIDHLAG
jgi:hypothetical protein